MEGLGEQNFRREMLGIEGLEPVELFDQSRCDILRFTLFRSAMHEAMSDGGEFAPEDSLLDPIHQHANRRRVIGRVDRAGKVIAGIRPFYGERRVGKPDSLDPTGENSPQHSPGLEQGELYARGAAVYRQDSRGFHDQPPAPRTRDRGSLRDDGPSALALRRPTGTANQPGSHASPV
jgi:hypothetical protein